MLDAIKPCLSLCWSPVRACLCCSSTPADGGQPPQGHQSNTNYGQLQAQATIVVSIPGAAAVAPAPAGTALGHDGEELDYDANVDEPANGLFASSDEDDTVGPAVPLRGQPPQGQPSNVNQGSNTIPGHAPSDVDISTAPVPASTSAVPLLGPSAPSTATAAVPPSASDMANIPGEYDAFGPAAMPQGQPNANQENNANPHQAQNQAPNSSGRPSDIQAQETDNDPSGSEGTMHYSEIFGSSSLEEPVGSQPPRGANLRNRSASASLPIGYVGVLHLRAPIGIRTGVLPIHSVTLEHNLDTPSQAIPISDIRSTHALFFFGSSPSNHGPAADDTSGDELESHGISSYSSSSSSPPATAATRVFVLGVSGGESSSSEAASSDSQGSGDDGYRSLRSPPGLNASISEEQTHDGLEVPHEAQSEIQVQNQVQDEPRPQPQSQPRAEDEHHPQAEAQPHELAQLQPSASARADDVQDTEVASGATGPQEFSDAQDLSGHHPPPSTPANQSLTRIPIDFPVHSLVDSLQSQVRSQPQLEGEGERSWSQVAQAEEVSPVEEEISKFSFEATIAAANASPHRTHASQFHPDSSQSQVDITSSDADTAQSHADTSRSSFEALSFTSRGTQGPHVQPNRSFVATLAQDVSGVLQETGITPSAEDFVIVDRQVSAAPQHLQHQPLVQNHPRQGADWITPEELPEHIDDLAQEHDGDMLQDEGARRPEDIDSDEHTGTPQEDPSLHSDILATTPGAVADSSVIQNASLSSSAIGTSYPLSQTNTQSSPQHLDSADDVAHSHPPTSAAPSPPKTPEAFDDSVYNDVPGSY